MEKQKKYPLSFIGWLIIVFSIFAISFSNMPHKVFAYDNFGFYMYLPNIIIHNDIAPKDISFIKEVNEQYELTPTLYQLAKADNDVWVIRFLGGISILLLPFFLIAHLVAHLTPYATDGYSLPYFIAMLIAAAFYASLAFFFIRKILLRYLPDSSVLISLLVLYWGTNLFFFTSLGSFSSHIFVLAEYSVLIWLTIKWHDDQKAKYARLLGLMIGLMAITRLSEIISLFIPLLWGVYNKETALKKVQLVLANKKQLFQLILFAFIGALPQMTYWLITTHQIYFNPYNDPQSQLILSNPRFINVLLSYRKGWFIYSPLMIISVLGFVTLYKHKKDMFWPIFVVFLINLYLIASFTSLVSYGYRAFIQSYAYMVIPFGFFIHGVMKQKLWIKILALVVVLPFIYLNVFQAKQIQMGTIHGSRMTKDYYWAVFLKDFPSEEDKQLLLVERSKTGIDEIKNEDSYQRSIILENDFENPEKGKESSYSKEIKYSGDYSMKIDSNTVYSKPLTIAYEDITDDYYVYLRPSVYIYPQYDFNAHDVFLVIHFENEGVAYKYKTVNFKDQNFKANQWNRVSLDYLSPEILSRDNILKVYIWNRDGQKFLMDDFKVESFSR